MSNPGAPVMCHMSHLEMLRLETLRSAGDAIKRNDILPLFVQGKNVVLSLARSLFFELSVGEVIIGHAHGMIVYHKGGYSWQGLLTIQHVSDGPIDLYVDIH